MADRGVEFAGFVVGDRADEMGRRRFVSSIGADRLVQQGIRFGDVAFPELVNRLRVSALVVGGEYASVMLGFGLWGDGRCSRRPSRRFVGGSATAVHVVPGDDAQGSE